MELMNHLTFFDCNQFEYIKKHPKSLNSTFGVFLVPIFLLNHNFPVKYTLSCFNRHNIDAR